MHEKMDYFLAFPLDSCSHNCSSYPSLLAGEGWGEGEGETGVLSIDRIIKGQRTTERNHYIYSIKSSESDRRKLAEFK
jgi:hypothetical protein